MRKSIFLSLIFVLVFGMAHAADTAAPAASKLGDVRDLNFKKTEGDPETWPGAALYKSSCGACHEGQVAKAPHKMFLQLLSGQTIDTALSSGLMQQQASGLSASQRREVAEYLSGGPFTATTTASAAPACTPGSSEFDNARPPQRSGWGYSNTRFVDGTEAGMTAADIPKLQLKWAMEFPDGLRARSQPAIAYGAVFVGSHDGHVYSLGLANGCMRWSFKAGGEVRTAVVPYEAPRAPNIRTLPPRVFFGDVIARVYSLEAATGKLQWSVKVDEHPNATLTGTPTFHNGVIYVPVSSLEVTTAADAKYECCKFRGAIVALDAWSGRQLWKSYTIVEVPKPVKTLANGTRVFAPSGAPIWNSPTIDVKRGVLYVGTGENYSSPANDKSDALIAFRLKDGKQVWSQQFYKGDAWNVACMMQDNPNCPVENGPDIDFGAGTILASLPSGKDILVAGQKNGFVYGIDLDTHGKTLWKIKLGRGGIQGGIHFGMALEGTRVYAPISDMKDGRDGRPVTGPPTPGLNAVDIVTGKLLWSKPADDVCGSLAFCDPGISAAVTAIPGVLFAGHMDGRFRAYDGTNGQVLFEFDAKQPIKTVSGSVAHGGSFGGGGAAVRDGYVAVSSGYGLYLHMPGNVLLVFAKGTTP